MLILSVISDNMNKFPLRRQYLSLYLILQDLALEGKREIRKAEWEAFTNYMDTQYQTVDTTFAEKETELKKFYVDLEQKLHIDI